MWRYGGQLYYRPGEIAINGMKRLDAWVGTGDGAQLDQALVQARKLRELADGHRSAWWLPFEFDFPRRGQEAPWYNAMAQGLVISFFVRLHRVTGAEIHLEAAHRVFRSFLRLGRDRHPWVAYVTGSEHLWLEHYPDEIGHHVLNAHLHATLGIFDLWQETGDPQARTVLEGALTTMRERVDRFRVVGEASRYCLKGGCDQDEHYHAIHIWQLRQLERIAGEPFFGRMANRFERDLTPRRPGLGSPGGR